MKTSNITLYNAIRYVNSFCPAKIIYNNTVLYNDYDSEVEIEEELYGEIDPPLSVVPERIKSFENSIVMSINIEIVDFHHSIVTMEGFYKYNK